MEEKNYTTLRDALDRLPQHQPPAGIWSALETEIEAEQNLARQTAALPVYPPPAAIWQNIEAQLDARPAVKTQANPLKVSHLRQWLAAAAAVVAVAVAVVFLKMKNNDTETIAVAQEQVDPLLLETIHEPENPAFDLVQNLCRERQPVCQQPDFQHLKIELDQLTSAKTTLREALGQYGSDPELVAELVKIERERSQILQQLVGMI